MVPKEDDKILDDIKCGEKRQLLAEKKICTKYQNKRNGLKKFTSLVQYEFF